MIHIYDPIRERLFLSFKAFPAFSRDVSRLYYLPQSYSRVYGFSTIFYTSIGFRSRSPPPSRDTAKSHKSGEIISRGEVWDGSDGRSSHKDPVVAPRQWGAPAQNRPNVRPPSPESQSSRRSRDPEYPSRSDFGNEAKRRRLDEPVEGRPRERRDRSPIAAENRERYYPEIHPDDMAGSYRHRELSNGTIRLFFAVQLQPRIKTNLFIRSLAT